MNEAVEITGLAHGGAGVARMEGRVCFVSHALPGDVVRVRVTREAKGVLFGVIESLETPSPHRAPTDCSVFGRCGGCEWLHFMYPAQGEWKMRIVRDCFERIGRFEVDVAWEEEPALRLGYRTRACFHGSGGRWGFYGRRGRDVVDIVSCPLCHSRLNAALGVLRECAVEESVEVTVNPEGDETLVWLARASNALGGRFSGVNFARDGRPRACFEFDGAPVVNGAFSQSSLLLNRLLRKRVASLAEGAQSVLDLYCGAGNLSLGLAAGARVMGLDHNAAAIEAARKRGAGVYRRGDEREFCRALGKESWDTVILDPPRAGAKAIVGALAACRAQRIIYVACDPATLARDVKELAAKGWRAERVIALDLFPHTAHVETICLLMR